MYFCMKLFYPIPYYDLLFIIFSYQHGMGDERGEILGDERGEIWEAVRQSDMQQMTRVMVISDFEIKNIHV